MELSHPLLRQSGECCCHLDATSGEPDETEPGQLIEVDGPGQGAAALCGGGEPKKVGDRSRSQERGPPAACGVVAERVSTNRRRGHGCDQRPLLGGAAGRSIGSVRRWRGFHHDGRTYTLTEVSGRCRDRRVLHRLFISAAPLTINSDI